MSIEMENPKTLMELADALANLTEQLAIAHSIKDEAHFIKTMVKARLFHQILLTKLEEGGFD